MVYDGAGSILTPWDVTQTRPAWNHDGERTAPWKADATVVKSTDPTDP